MDVKYSYSDEAERHVAVVIVKEGVYTGTGATRFEAFRVATRKRDEERDRRRADAMRMFRARAQAAKAREAYINADVCRRTTHAS